MYSYFFENFLVLVVRCLPETIGIYLQVIQLFHRRNDRYVKMYGCYLVVLRKITPPFLFVPPFSMKVITLKRACSRRCKCLAK